MTTIRWFFGMEFHADGSVRAYIINPDGSKELSMPNLFVIFSEHGEEATHTSEREAYIAALQLAGEDLAGVGENESVEDLRERLHEISETIRVKVGF